MAQGQKLRATPEQLAALDAELEEHHIKLEDPKHPLAERPQTALADAMIVGLELKGGTGCIEFLVTLCKVSKPTARTWLKDSRNMSRNAVAIVLDVLADALYHNPYADGTYAEDAYWATRLDETAQENGEPTGKGMDLCRVLAFELLFTGAATTDRQKLQTIEIIRSILGTIDDEQLEALLKLLKAFHALWPYKEKQFIDEADPMEVSPLVERHARQVLLEARRLYSWARRRNRARRIE